MSYTVDTVVQWCWQHWVLLYNWCFWYYISQLSCALNYGMGGPCWYFKYSRNEPNVPHGLSLLMSLIWSKCCWSKCWVTADCFEVLPVVLRMQKIAAHCSGFFLFSHNRCFEYKKVDMWSAVISCDQMTLSYTLS